MPSTARVEVDSLLDQLEAAGTMQTPRPLDSEQLWGNYVVAYTSTQRTQDQGQRASVFAWAYSMSPACSPLLY